jgi:uncharacterized membrane protein
MTERRLTFAIAGLSLLGVAIAGYLTWIHYSDIDPICTTGGCEKVQGSEYAELAGIPVAVIGLVGYFGILASLALRGELGRTVTALMALVGFGYSLYLTYLELAVIDAICQWCVASAAVMTALALLAATRVVTAD